MSWQISGAQFSVVRSPKIASYSNTVPGDSLSLPFFLKYLQRLEDMLERQRALDAALAAGDPLPENLTTFRHEYRELISVTHVSAERRLGASLAGRCKGRTMCWDLMRKIRQPSRGVAIDSETLVGHFSSIFYDPNEPLYFDPETLGISPPIDFELNLFSDDELVSALNALNAQAATGPQRVASRYIKAVFVDARIRVVLLALMNMCFAQGRVPVRWGDSEVFILYKGKGEVTDPINYRGINLNDDFLRLYERLLDSRMSLWLRESNPWGPQQFGFSEGVGTEDAFLCLETLARVCTIIHRVPFYANFIDLQRAFPSMLRSRALQVLHEMGLPFELTRAFASTFSGNSCRLKINNKLTRVFFVNRGTKEGGINSPRIFNTVYAYVLNKLNIVSFPRNVSDFDPNKVYYLIFADDLVLMSGNLTLLENRTNELDAALADVGMSVNSKKCKWLAYLPRFPNLDAILWPSRFAIEHRGTFIENVEVFRYLGFQTRFDLSSSEHVKSRVTLLSLAARLTGRLLRSLEITNFRSLRAYFYALVGSQLYSLSVFSFPEHEYDRAIKQYLQECFNLPSSYPMAVAKFVLRIDDLIIQAFRARTNFFQRVLNGRNSDASLSAMGMDRGSLFHRGIGWNADFARELSDHFNFSSLDLSSQTSVSVAHDELQTALARRRRERFRTSSSSFILDLFPNLTIPAAFWELLNEIPHESIRVILIFFANMFQYTYFRSSSTTCPFCSDCISSRHLFNCSGITTNQNYEWSSFTQDFLTGDFRSAIDRLFLVIQRWATLTNRFQPALTARLDEYFAYSHSRTASSSLAMSLTL